MTEAAEEGSCQGDGSLEVLSQATIAPEPCNPVILHRAVATGPRKSVEPMAARIAPARVQTAHQSLHHLVANADWSDEAVLTAIRERLLPEIERHGAIRAWIVDDTGFPKTGTHSVGPGPRMFSWNRLGPSASVRLRSWRLLRMAATEV
jgi:hypothetical protein